MKYSKRNLSLSHNELSCQCSENILNATITKCSVHNLNKVNANHSSTCGDGDWLSTKKGRPLLPAQAQHQLYYYEEVQTRWDILSPRRVICDAASNVLSDVWAKEKRPCSHTQSSMSRTSALPLLEWYIHFTCIIPRLFFAPYIMSRGLARAPAPFRLIFMKFGPDGEQNSRACAIFKQHTTTPAANSVNEKFGLRDFWWLMAASQFR